PFVCAFVDGDVGLNLGQGPDPSRPGRVANFAGRGVTHAGVGAAFELRARRTPGVGWTTVAAGFRVQLNMDDATRANGVGRTRDLGGWLWMSATVLLGGEARGLRGGRAAWGRGGEWGRMRRRGLPGVLRCIPPSAARPGAPSTLFSERSVAARAGLRRRAWG